MANGGLRSDAHVILKCLIVQQLAFLLFNLHLPFVKCVCLLAKTWYNLKVIVKSVGLCTQFRIASGSGFFVAMLIG